MLVGLSVRTSPAGDPDADSVTVPAKLLRLARVIVELEEDPALMASEDGLAVMLKSPELTELTVTATVVLWDSEPLVPVIVTVYVPGFEELTDSVDVAVPPAVRVTLVELNDRLSPLGELVADRATVPAKSLRLARVMVDVEEDPALMVSEEGFAEMVKSGEGVVGLKNSVIGVALPSPVLRLAKFQFVSIVFGNE
jgi:hypothetical protein